MGPDADQLPRRRARRFDGEAQAEPGQAHQGERLHLPPGESDRARSPNSRCISQPHTRRILLLMTRTRCPHCSYRQALDGELTSIRRIYELKDRAFAALWAVFAAAMVGPTCNRPRVISHHSVASLMQSRSRPRMQSRMQSRSRPRAHARACTWQVGLFGFISRLVWGLYGDEITAALMRADE